MDSDRPPFAAFKGSRRNRTRVIHGEEAIGIDLNATRIPGALTLSRNCSIARNNDTAPTNLNLSSSATSGRGTSNTCTAANLDSAIRPQHQLSCIAAHSGAKACNRYCSSIENGHLAGRSANTPTIRE
jgi:hypothetical protein